MFGTYFGSDLNWKVQRTNTATNWSSNVLSLNYTNDLLYETVR